MAPKPVAVRWNANSSNADKGDTDKQPPHDSTIKSTLTQEDVNELMKKYNLSSLSALAAGDVLAINPPPKHIVVYEHTLENGLFLPFSSFIKSTLRQLCLIPGLLLPCDVRILVGFEFLCFYHDIPCKPDHFIQLFQLHRVKNHIFFLPRPKSPRIYCNLLRPYKEWKDKFFFLEYDLGMDPESPLNDKNSKRYQLDTENPDVHSRFQASRVMDLSKGWDKFLVRDYLRLAQESIFSDYTWRSESYRLQVLNHWKNAFEQRSRSRNEYEKIATKVSVTPVGKSVEQTNVQEASSTEGEGEFAGFSRGLNDRKRCLSQVTPEVTTEEPAPARAKIQSSSNVSDQDVEGQQVELNGVLGQKLPGGVAGTPIIPVSRNCFSQNLPAVGEDHPVNMTSIAVDMEKISSRFHSSTMEYEEKLAQLEEALDAKSAECQAWEEIFNMSRKEHELALLKQEEEFDQKLKKCLKENALLLSKQKEYEKLLEDQKSDIKLLKEQKEAVDIALNKMKLSFLNGLSDIEKANSLQTK